MFRKKLCIGRRDNMINAILFLFGFTAVVGVYEVAKSGSKGRTSKIEKTISGCKKFLK